MPELRNYTPKEYSGGPQVWNILQDRRGVLFFAMAAGVLEYDGVTWRKIPVPSGVVRSLSMDAAGKVWVGADANFGYLERDAHGTLQYVSLVEKIPPEHRIFGDVWQVLIAPQGSFFRSYARLFRWDGKRMQVWATKTRFQALSEVRGHIYTSQTGIGLQEIVGDELHAAPGGDAYKNSVKLLLHPYDERRMLVSARSEALTLYDGGKVTPFPTQADDYLKKNDLYTSAPLPDGSFCLNTLHGGAIVLEHDGRPGRILDKDSGLQNQSVYAAYPDREGALWLGLGQGIARVDVNSPISLFSRDSVSDVVRHDGSLYAAAGVGATSLFHMVPNRETGLSSLQPIRYPLSLNQAFELLVFRDPAGKTPPQLLATTSLGVLKIDGDTASPALPRERGLVEPARSLLQSRKSPNRVFVGNAASLSSMRWEDGKWIDEGRLSTETVMGSLAEEPDGTLWAGSAAGMILRLTVPATGMRDATVERFNEKEGLGRSVNAVVSAAGEIFAIPHPTKSMHRWDAPAHRFVVDNRFLLPLNDPDAAASLFPLPNGDIWSIDKSSNDQRQGIFHRQADGTWQFDESTFRGLSHLQEEHVRLDPDGSLWIAGDDGLVRFDPRVKPSAGQSFSALVRRVSSGPEDIVFGGTPAAAASALRLSYARNSLQFEFAAPTYGSEAETQYQYLLEGAAKDWSAWGKQKGANYSSLGPGSYRFRVRARSVDGRTSEEGVFRFTILPPWYRTTLAYIVCGLLFVLLALGAWRLVVAREREKSRRRTEELEATVAERTREISNQAAELATINRITQALSTQLDKDRLIQLVGDQVRDLFHAPIAYVALLDRATMMLSFPYSFGEQGAQALPFGEGLTSQIIRTGQPLLINEDLEGSSARIGVQRIGRRAASYLGVPIFAGGEAIGAIGVQSTDRENRFTEADQRLLSTVAGSVGVAMYNARLFEEARQARGAAEEARAAAEQADAAKSSFLSTVSHELRTPLTSVLGFAKIIRRRLDERLFPLIPEDDKKILQTKRQVMDNLNVVVSEGERLTTLINDVLDLAKIQAGKITWNMATISIGTVIERAIAATASLFEAKKLNLVRDIQPDLPDITGDRDRLIQVVINLISNAVKFTDAGSVACAASLGKGELVVSVTDSGIGIKLEDQPKVFERFKQVGDTLTDKPQGTGLGLPISKEIVEHHGGRMWVESEIGRGSSFFFTLPVAASVPAQVPADAPAPRALDMESLVRQLRDNVANHQPRPRSVLVVDDDPNIRSVLQQEFTEAGYTVRLAEDGRKALALIREETPGIVILDVMMPEMNGFDVTAVLKNDPTTSDIPIVILSIVEDKERGFRLGVDRYLTKPIDTVSLFREVGTLLDQGRSKKKVMVVDEDASTLRTLTDALQVRGYHVVESNGAELVANAVSGKPDIIVLSSLLSNDAGVRSLRFQKGLENVQFLIYQ